MQKFSATQIGIITLTLITAVIHLVLGSSFGDTLFILNGLGFLGLLAATFLPLSFLNAYRAYAHWALLAYAGITIIAYFIVNPDPWGSVFGLVTKAVEAILIILLYKDKP